MAVLVTDPSPKKRPRVPLWRARTVGDVLARNSPSGRTASIPLSDDASSDEQMCTCCYVAPLPMEPLFFGDGQLEHSKRANNGYHNLLLTQSHYILT